MPRISSNRVHHWRYAAALLAAAALWLAWLPAAPSYEELRAAWRPSDAWLLDRHGAVIDQRRIDFGVRRLEWVPLDAVSPALVAAVVAGEDRRFWQHTGIDWRGIAAALRDTLVHGRRRGASTITMQLAELLPVALAAPATGPAWWRKLRQMRAARGLEANWTKRQILEAYLNLLGFRGELVGIGAAAAELAGKTPAGLDLGESLVLAALLPAPGAGAERIAARACARARALAPLTPPDCLHLGATTRELLARRRTAPATAHLSPQLAQRLLQAPGARVRTTLDARIQSLATDVLARQLAQLGGRNVRDGAALVVDTVSGEVLAYVASARGTSRAAAVDGIRARRQAGSTLKPFLYGLALERRYLTAASLLDDSPVNLDTASGLYIPQNYDRDFKGLVSVRSALGSSLNVPAVRALVLTGVEPFRDRLHELGYAGLTRSGDYYGFSLALGSAEVSLWEQAQAYRTLARGGLYTPLRLGPDEPPAKERRVLPADASFIVTDILADPAARAATFGAGSHLDTAFWSAVKTGTSKDLRDNWCIGFSPRYTVAVWVGNFEGDSMHDVSGVSGAAPIWAELMAALHRDLAVVPPRPPAGLSAELTTFTPPVEAPRREWFLDGTAQANVTAAGPRDAIAHIASPANATVIALDPDIPPAVQRVAITAKGASDGLRFRLDGALLGTAAGTLLWRPVPGTHRLALEDARGRTVDEVQFIVR